MNIKKKVLNFFLIWKKRKQNCASNWLIERSSDFGFSKLFKKFD